MRYPKAEANLFFRTYAGVSYNPAKETEAQGRRRGAIELAHAEAIAHRKGWTCHWRIDPYGSSADFSDEQPAWKLYECALFNKQGKIIASLHGIDFGRDGGPIGDTYARVVEAQLALEALER